MDRAVYLNEKEVAEVEKFCDNPIQKEAVRKVLLAGIYYNGTLKQGEKADPTRNFALFGAFDPTTPSEQLGENVKAAAQAIAVVENSFNELNAYRSEKKKELKRKHNPAE